MKRGTEDETGENTERQTERGAGRTAEEAVDATGAGAADGVLGVADRQDRDGSGYEPCAVDA